MQLRKGKKEYAIKCCRVRGSLWRREMRNFPEILWRMFGLIRCPAPSTASKRPEEPEGQIRFLATRSRPPGFCKSSSAGTGMGRPGRHTNWLTECCGLCGASPFYREAHRGSERFKYLQQFPQSRTQERALLERGGFPALPSQGPSEPLAHTGTVRG